MLHVISKRCEDTVIIPIKLEGDPLMLAYSKDGRLITYILIVLTVDNTILRYLIRVLPFRKFKRNHVAEPSFMADCRVYTNIMLN